MIKYFKYTSVKGEYTTHRLIEAWDEERLKQYPLHDEDDTFIFSIKYDKDSELSTFKKKQEKIKLVEINEDEFKSLRNPLEQYQIEHQGELLDRSIELGSSKISINENVELDANELALSRFTYLVTLANAKYNIEVSKGTSPEEAAAVYKTGFKWKGADNSWVTFTVEDIIVALEKGVMNLQTIWEKYN